jgi:hypothetical protein
MRLILSLAILALLVLPLTSVQAASSSWTVSSPDGALTFELRLDEVGALSYRLTLGPSGAQRVDVLGWSPLGVTRDDQPFVKGLKATLKGTVRIVDDSYTMLHGKRSDIRHRAKEVTFSFTNAAGAPLHVIVRVADDGAAFRYRFPNTDPTPRRVMSEATGFAVPGGAQAWIAPRSPAGKYTPAYEDLYVERPAGMTSPLAGGWDIPALFRIADGAAWALVSESAVDERYAASHLAGDAAAGVYRLRLPDAAEGQGVGKAKPESPLPWTLPWRVIVAGATPARIFESTLVDDLAPPSTLRDTSWIKPGRASWSWWSDDDSPKSEAALDRFTDFGQAMGWEYSLVDANWNLMDPAAFARVRAHAREKGVGLLLWYNSGGPHNVVTEQPRDRMHQREVRRKEFAMLRDWGIKGVKVDFWQSDKQDRMAQYLDLLRDAADFQLMVDFHGCTLPRGWERTYPHLMSMEAVPGAEQYKFNAKYPEAAAWHNTVLAFTRNVVGSMDYTPVTFSDSKYPHLTTYGHELALSVVFESGLQHFADSVQAYEALPAAARDFLKAVSAAWDESRLLAGEPGKLVVVARRKGTEWNLGGISGTDAPQTISVDLSALGSSSHTLAIIGDGSGPRALTSETTTVAAGEPLKVDLLPRGGFVARVGH